MGAAAYFHSRRLCDKISRRGNLPAKLGFAKFQNLRPKFHDAEFYMPAKYKIL